MRSVLFRIPIPGLGSLPIYAYGLMAMVGFLVGITVARRRARTVGIHGEAILDMGLIAVCGGILGARIFHVFQNWGDYFRGEGESPIVRIMAINRGGLVWYGGLILAGALIMLYIRRKKLPLLRTLDVLAPSAMLGLGFGRIGCFLNGCCYGQPSGLPWAVKFPEHALAYTSATGMPLEPGTYLHPTELYMSATAFVLFGILSWIFYHHRRDGEVICWMALLYSIGRFINEYFRADTWVPAGLTASQKIGVFIFALAVLFGIWVRLYGPKAIRPGAAAAVPQPAGGGPQPQSNAARGRGRKRHRL